MLLINNSLVQLSARQKKQQKLVFCVWKVY